MQRMRTGFSTLMLALSMQAAAVVSAAQASAASPNDWGLGDSAADDFVFTTALEKQQIYEPDFAAPQQFAASVSAAWTPSADDANAHIFMLLQHVGSNDFNDSAHHDYLLS